MQVRPEGSLVNEMEKTKKKAATNEDTRVADGEPQTINSGLINNLYSAFSLLRAMFQNQDAP